MIYLIKVRLSSKYYFSDICIGSKALCEYAIDKEDVFLESSLKNLLWPSKISGWSSSTTTYKRIKTMTQNMIIIKLQFKSPEVELTVLDSRSTVSDKIAKLGGTFGIWAQLTGCTLLVLINVFVIIMKLGFKVCGYRAKPAI